MKHSITNALIIISFFSMIVGCYTENKALKQVGKAHIKYSSSVAKYCSALFPSTDATVDSIVYLPGESIVINDTLLVHDTTINQITEYIKQYHTRIDTIYRLKSVQVVNRSKEAYLTDSNMKVSIELARTQKERQILYWVVGILGIYTLGRWIIRFWGIRLP